MIVANLTIQRQYFFHRINEGTVTPPDLDLLPLLLIGTGQGAQDLFIIMIIAIGAAVGIIIVVIIVKRK